MKNISITGAAFFFILIIIASCGKSIDKPIFWEDGELAIDSEIEVTLTLDSLENLVLYFSTTKIYPCGNFLLNYTINKTNNTPNAIDIRFTEVLLSPGGICLTTIEPATAIFDLKKLNNGTYLLNLYNGDVRHTGQLVVTSEKYQANFGDNPNFIFTNKTLNK